MKYQFVIQFSQNSQNKFDHLIGLEDQLEQLLNSDSEIDGHDIGNDQMNIFIMTNKPIDLFNQIKHLLINNKFSLGKAKVAYREINNNNFIILFPRDLKTFELT